MASDLTIPNIPSHVLEALRDLASRRDCTVEEAAVDVLQGAVEQAGEQDEIDAAWAAEIARRVEAMDRGETRMYDGEEVFRELEAEMDHASGSHRDESAA